MNMDYPPPPQGGCCQFKLPFLENNASQIRHHQSYWQMLSYYFSPYFTIRSWSFLFIVVTFLCMVVPQFLFPQMGMTQKLFSYTMIPGVYMSPIEVKYVNHASIYKCFTTMFFHLNYTHWLGNLLGITINLFTMEFCWLPSIVLMLIGGTVTSAYASLVMNNMLMGFSGVIACSVGLYIGMFIGNWNHIRTHYGGMLAIWFMNCIFVFLLLFSNDPRSTLVHFIALGIGLVYGLGWVPKLQPDGCQSMTGLICKIISLIITVLPFILIFMHPATGQVPAQGLFPNQGMPGLPNQQQFNFQQPGINTFAKQPQFNWNPFQSFQSSFQQPLFQPQFQQFQAPQWF